MRVDERRQEHKAKLVILHSQKLEFIGPKVPRQRYEFAFG